MRDAGARPSTLKLPEGIFGAFTKGGTPPPAELVPRIKRAYRLAVSASRGAGESMWAAIAQRNVTVHEALLSDDDRFENVLRNPGQSDLFYGFHSLFASRNDELRAASEADRSSATAGLLRELFRLGEAIGVRRISNPEAVNGHEQSQLSATNIDQSLRALDDLFGARIEFPNPFPDEFGLQTDRGIVSYRAIHALYQAFRLRQLSRAHGPCLLEIGAGLGRTISYAGQMGLTQCTIVDLPMTNVAQASFLGHTLGPQSITLFGEDFRPGSVRIMPPEWLRSCEEKFDVVLNVDSMTEMDRGFAEEYASFIQGHAKCFLSINHDANAFRVRDLAALKSLTCDRFPYWMREGYTEEIYLQPAS